MRALWFLPFTFLAGAHGFALFAPYLALVFAALHLRAIRRARKTRPAANLSHDSIPLSLPAGVAIA